MSAIVGPKVEKPSDRAWWKSASVYQSESLLGHPATIADQQSIPYASPLIARLLSLLILQASFADHADNGHGTLQGILSKVPYLHKLGVDIVWLSPMYESPQADMGYDISNYQEVDPRYGTLKDWEQIKDACHERGMKLVMDLVVNHSSDQVSFQPFRWDSADYTSMPGSRRAEAPKTAPRGIGTSGMTARPMTKARRFHPTTGGPSSERESNREDPVTRC